MVDTSISIAPNNSDETSKPTSGYSVTLSEAQRSDITADFGFYTPNIIGDTVWLDDIDGDGIGDGIYDPDGADNILGNSDDEVGVAGVDVYLYVDAATPEALSAPIAQARTDANGRYSFANIADGSYRIKIDIPRGYLATAQSVMSDDDVDSDIIDDQYDIWYGYTEQFDVLLDEIYRDIDGIMSQRSVDMHLDAGIITTPLSALGNIVWNDRDADGIYEPNGNDGNVATTSDNES